MSAEQIEALASLYAKFDGLAKAGEAIEIAHREIAKLGGHPELSISDKHQFIALAREVAATAANAYRMAGEAGRQYHEKAPGVIRQHAEEIAAATIKARSQKPITK